jgi:hypothetical protein
MRRQPNVNLRIERLVLHGYSFTKAEMVRFERSMTRELTALVRERGMPARGYAEASVSAPMSAASADPVRLGREVARSICDCLDPEL